MTDVRHILVLPDREAAEETAEEIARDLAARFGDGPGDGLSSSGGSGGSGASGGSGGSGASAGSAVSGGLGASGLGDDLGDGSDDGFDVEGELQVVREALAGEDDAEDAQWLVVLQGPRERYDAERLDALANERDGWLERS